MSPKKSVGGGPRRRKEHSRGRNYRAKAWSYDWMPHLRNKEVLAMSVWRGKGRHGSGYHSDQSIWRERPLSTLGLSRRPQQDGRSLQVGEGMIQTPTFHPFLRISQRTVSWLLQELPQSFAMVSGNCSTWKHWYTLRVSFCPSRSFLQEAILSGVVVFRQYVWWSARRCHNTCLTCSIVVSMK